MKNANPKYVTRFATTEADLRSAQLLRHRVFVEELGANSKTSDQLLESDRFDAFSSHLLLLDLTRDEGDQVIGVYRLMSSEQASAAGGFSSEEEYDLDVLKASGKTLLELGRSCIDPEYRDGLGLFHLWSGLHDHIDAVGAEILFGVASFKGKNRENHKHQLALLHHKYLAPTGIRVVSREPQTDPLIPIEQIDVTNAMVQMPPLIKAYLRLGGMIGQGSYVDKDFNTTDVCMIVDIAQVGTSVRKKFAGANG